MTSRRFVTKEEGKQSIVPNEKFVILRNDPTDCFKPNSDDAVAVLATAPISEKLTKDDAAMLREVAADMDLSLPLDEIEDFPAKTTINDECRAQLARLPTWLRSMIGSRWEIIHKHYGHNSYKFLKVIANRVEHQYRNQYLKVIEAATLEEEEVPPEEPYKGFELRNEESVLKKPITAASAFLVAQSVGRFRSRHQTKKFWDQNSVLRAETCLRAAMVTRAAVVDMTLVAEENMMKEMTTPEHDEYENDSEEEREALVTHKPLHKGGWEIMDEGGDLKEKAKEEIEEKFHQKNVKLLSHEERNLEKFSKKMAKIDKKKRKIGCFSFLKGNPLCVTVKKRKEKKRYLLERALHRRYSRIWYKDCGELIKSKKLGHQYRIDEDIHEFIVSIVTWTPFKFLIMFIILSNALLLALETQKSLEKFENTFTHMDTIFLSVYTAEFMLKIYAHPYRYWKSGYNMFDFIILLISLAKVTIDWLDVAEITFLRLLLIVRALRILRGVSMSIQLQVLVTALVETVKTHVLSVVILLVLVLYIAAVAAFYLFSERELLKKPWGNIAFGMLRMFSFVTMDGWTDISRRFERADMYLQGRIFSLAGIVLGNFLFSSIFIAIIIMNISEATDAHRERQREEEEVIVNQKKDIIFRRQHMTMRQLLARQRVSVSSDFFHVASQFQRLLRHDDLVAMQEVCTSPLWLDSLYKTFSRCHHTANVLMNLHREIADNLLEFYKYYGEGRYKVEPISRGRYNRYMKIKAKLALIKNEIYRQRHPEMKYPLKIRLPSDDTSIPNPQESAKSVKSVPKKK